MGKEGTVTIELPDGTFICELPDVGEPEKWRLFNSLAPESWGEPVAVHPNHAPIFLTSLIDEAEKE